MIRVNFFFIKSTFDNNIYCSVIINNNDNKQFINYTFTITF